MPLYKKKQNRIKCPAVYINVFPLQLYPAKEFFSKGYRDSPPS